MESLRQLEGKYEIQEKLHEGGMGSIYLVLHRLLKQQRVVKTMRRQLAAEEEFQNRFLREAQLAASLTHPNIAQIHDFTVDASGVGFIVMEYIDGVSLQEILVASGAPELEPTLEIARQTLRALSFLHREGYVHRDISPDNIMLSEDVDGRPQVKLIDLGIAKKLGGAYGLTTAGHFLGKVRYSCPENFKPEGVASADKRSDVYSFGLVLYELLTGQPAVLGNDLSSLYVGHVDRPPQAFATTDPEGRVPEELRQVVLRALDKDPDKRFANAEAFANALSRVHAAHLLAPDFAVARLLEPARRNRRKRLETMVGGSTQGQLDRKFSIGTAPVHRLESSNALGNLRAEAYLERQEKPISGQANGAYDSTTSKPPLPNSNTHDTSFDKDRNQQASNAIARVATTGQPQTSAAAPVIRKSTDNPNLVDATQRLDNSYFAEVNQSIQQPSGDLIHRPALTQQNTSTPSSPTQTTTMRSGLSSGGSSENDFEFGAKESDHAPKQDDPSYAGPLANESPPIEDSVLEPRVPRTSPAVSSSPPKTISPIDLATSSLARTTAKASLGPSVPPPPPAPPLRDFQSGSGSTLTDTVGVGEITQSMVQPSTKGSARTPDAEETRIHASGSQQEGPTPYRLRNLPVFLDRNLLPIGSALAGVAILIAVSWVLIEETKYRPPEMSSQIVTTETRSVPEDFETIPKDPDTTSEELESEERPSPPVTKAVEQNVPSPSTETIETVPTEPFIDLDPLGDQLLRSLMGGPVKDLRKVIIKLRKLRAENRKAFDGLDGAVRTAFEKGDKIIAKQDRLRYFQKEKAHFEVISTCQRLVDSYPPYAEFAEKHRTKAAEAVEKQAAELESAGDLTEASLQLQRLQEVWPDREGLATRIAELEKRKTVSELVAQPLAEAEKATEKM